MKIYTDLDCVLHDFAVNMVKAMDSLYGLCLEEEEVRINTLDYLVEKYSVLTHEDILKAIEKGNQSKKWIPTPWGLKLAEFLKEQLNSGSELIVITARSSIIGAEAICEQIFNQNVPIISCRSEYKHLAMFDGDIYLEDHPDIANKCAKEFPSMQVFVPKWDWNKNKIKNYNNIHLIEQEDYVKTIKENIRIFS